MKYFNTERGIYAVREDSPEYLRLSSLYIESRSIVSIEHQYFNGDIPSAVSDHFEKNCVHPVTKVSQITKEEFLAELDRSMSAIRDFREKIR